MRGHYYIVDRLFAAAELRLGDEDSQQVVRIALSTLLGIGSELATRDDDDALIAAGRESAFESANDVGQEITRRNLDIQPTIRVRPGFPLRVIVNRDLILRPYSE